MKILVISHFSSDKYSGGRFAAWNIVAGLNIFETNLIEVWTNNVPIYHKKYEKYNIGVNRIKYDLTLNRKLIKKGDYDITILVPENTESSIHRKAVLSSQVNDSKLVLYNFETPNWFNLLSKVKRDNSLWDDWLYASKFSTAILSISKTSEKYARKYYDNKYHFNLIGPIDSFAADEVIKEKPLKQNEITFLARFSSHKMDDIFYKLFVKELANYTFKFIVGSGGIPKDIRKKIDKFSKKHNIKIKIFSKISEKDKFRELAKSKCLFFFSQFEGLGIPPYEALYVGTNCISLELEVLKEITNKIIFTNNKNLINSIKSIKDNSLVKDDIVHEVFNFNKSSTRLNNLMRKINSIKMYKPRVGRFQLIRSIIYRDIKYFLSLIKLKFFG
jgi:hypothetical protein